MVKNTKGGSKQKSIARKSTITEHASRDPVPSHEDEFIARVDKMLGNGMCHVVGVEDQVVYLCHIRGKFRGRRKSQNIITPNVFVLAGKRSWQLEQKKECDLLCILQKVYGEIPGENDSAHTGMEIVFSDKMKTDDDDNDNGGNNANKTIGVLPASDDEVDFDDI
jgi:hypothetical protein